MINIHREENEMLKLTKIMQIGVVTDDLEAMTEHYKKLGFTNWHTADFGEDMGIPVHYSGDNWDGSPLIFKGMICSHEGYEVEIIEPLGPGFFMDWLKEHGPGVHHVKFELEDDYDTFIKEYKEAGYKSLVECTFGDSNLGFTYLDTSKELGFCTELYRGKPFDPETSSLEDLK